MMALLQSIALASVFLCWWITGFAHGYDSSWQSAHTFAYGGSDASGTMGACGGGNLYSQGYYGTNTALSTALFANNGLTGACCYERCNMEESDPQCLPGTVWTVTATNFPNSALPCPNDNGGWPLQHFDCNPMAEPAYKYRGGIVPQQIAIMFRRVRKGGVVPCRFTMNGFNLVLITNHSYVGGVHAVSIKGSNASTGWQGDPMSRGQNWQNWSNSNGQTLYLSFQTSDVTGTTAISSAPPDDVWQFGQTFEGNQF
uniref:Expansin n=1 Tax=Picea wilsonii TaxID=162304 RepID=A0A076JP64_PICWI|nr:expansin protein [Picea wilsonii]